MDKLIVSTDEHPLTFWQVSNTHCQPGPGLEYRWRIYRFVFSVCPDTDHGRTGKIQPGQMDIPKKTGDLTIHPIILQFIHSCIDSGISQKYLA